MLASTPSDVPTEAAKLDETSVAKLCTSAAAAGSRFDMSDERSTDISKALVSISNTAVISILGTGIGVGIGVGADVGVVVDSPAVGADVEFTVSAGSEVVGTDVESTGSAGSRVVGADVESTEKPRTKRRSERTVMVVAKCRSAPAS